MVEVEEGKEKTEKEKLGQKQGVKRERRRAYCPKHLHGCAT